MPGTEACPCCSGLTYTQCCGRFLTQGAYPQQADLLMRSRFTAYTLNDVNWLRRTWHPKTCPPLSPAELSQTHWSRLELLRHEPGLKKSIVEFKAWYITDNGEACLHEVSLFRKVRNRWVYLEPMALHETSG